VRSSLIAKPSPPRIAIARLCGERPDPAQPFLSPQHREQVAIRSVVSPLEKEERIMPVLLMWAVPAVIVIGGASYWFLHLH